MQLEALHAAGVTGALYFPTGPVIERELSGFAEAA
jgi:hypothetical protein